jgi:membrane-associated protein
MDLMHLLTQFVEKYILHLDVTLGEIIARYATGTYLILFAVVFCETGLVVTPFLPGDSLLFAVGTFAALGKLDVLTVTGILIVAAILGDTLNYWVGHKIGPKAFRRDSRFLNRKHLEQTQAFYEKHGGKTIIIARFMPIIRTFAPFVAGVGSMSYGRFIAYNVIGGVLWVVLFVFGGFFFGNIPMVKRNFTLVIFVIIFLSILPGIIGYARHLLQKRSGKPADAEPRG